MRGARWAQSLALFGGAVLLTVLTLVMTRIVEGEIGPLVVFSLAALSALLGALAGALGLRQAPVRSTFGVVLSGLFLAFFVWSFVTTSAPV